MAPDGNVLALVARHPRPGTVKTRLAAELGDQPVHALYCAFLRDLAERLAGGPWSLHWLYTPEDAPFPAWLGTSQAASPQHGVTFNDRLLNGFRLLNESRAKVIIMSTDSPHVPLDWIAEGFALLDQHDVVLGPCTDGGYYLIGMRAVHDVFTGIGMSTSTVLAETLDLAEQRGLRAALLPETFDVDDLDGLAMLTTWLDTKNAGELPRTRGLLSIRTWKARSQRSSPVRAGRGAPPLPGVQIATTPTLATASSEREDTMAGETVQQAARMIVDAYVDQQNKSDMQAALGRDQATPSPALQRLIQEHAGQHGLQAGDTALLGALRDEFQRRHMARQA